MGSTLIINSYSNSDSSNSNSNLHGSERDTWGQHYWGHCKFHVFDRGTFGGTLVNLLLSYQKCQGVPFLHNRSKNLTFAAAPLVLTPFVRNRGLAWCEANVVPQIQTLLSHKNYLYRISAVCCAGTLAEAAHASLSVFMVSGSKI